MKRELRATIVALLSVINGCLTHQMRHNSNLIYTILVEKEQLSVLASTDEFATELENINILIEHFATRIERLGKHAFAAQPFLGARMR